MNAPNVYFCDSGLLHAMQDVRTLPDLLAHPRCGASREGFSLEQVLRQAKPNSRSQSSERRSSQDRPSKRRMSLVPNEYSMSSRTLRW